MRKTWTSSEIADLCYQLTRYCKHSPYYTLMPFFNTPYAVEKNFTKQDLDDLRKRYKIVDTIFFQCKALFVQKIFEKEKLAKVEMKYLEVWDDYLREKNFSSEIDKAIAAEIGNYFKEDYSEEVLSGIFEKIHEENLKKKKKSAGKRDEASA